MGDGAGGEREDTSEWRAEWRETRWGSSCNQQQRETCDVLGGMYGGMMYCTYMNRSIGEMYGVYILVHFQRFSV